MGGAGSGGADATSKDVWAGDCTEEYDEVGLLTADVGLAPTTPKAFATAGDAGGAAVLALAPNKSKAAAAGDGAGAVVLEPSTPKAAAAAGVAAGAVGFAPKTPKAAAAPVE